jgi:hypothetical protein
VILKKDIKAKFVFRLFAALLCVLNILFVFKFFSTGSYSGFLYYTVLSNIVVLAMFVLLLVKPKMTFPRLQAGTLLCIMLTFLVFWCILVPTVNIKYVLSYESLGVHFITPLLFLADYIMFCERGRIKKYDPLLFAVVPLTYAVLATILGFCGVEFSKTADGKVMHFPYFFMDFYTLGVWAVGYIILICIIYFGMGYALYWTDNKIKEKHK